MKKKNITIEKALHLYIENSVEAITNHNERICFLRNELDLAIKNKDSNLIFLINNELMQQRASLDKTKTLIAFCNKLLKYAEESNEQ